MGVRVAKEASSESPRSERPRLLSVERQRAIAELLRERGTVHAASLVDLFGVTDETIRRDLNVLSERGVLQRIHGGATSGAVAETTFDQRLGVHEAEKVAIARYAANLVHEGMRVILDSGTTTLALARMLRNKGRLVVVTNALTHALELLRNPEATVIMTGGILRRSTFGAVGDLGVDAFAQVHVDLAFMAIHSVSAATGLTYPTVEETAIKRAMMASADQVTLLADGSKIGRSSLIRVAPISAVHRIVTAGSFDATEARAIRELGIELVVADMEQPAMEDPRPPVVRAASRTK